ILVDPSQGEGFYDTLLHNSALIYLISRHFPERLAGLSGQDIERALGPVMDEAFNTLSSAHAILAMDAYADAVGSPKSGQFRVFEIGEQGQKTPLVLPEGLFPSAAFSQKAK